MKQFMLILTMAAIFTLSLTAADKTKTISLNITGMTCESCVGTVQKALQKVNGVKEAKVDLKSSKATVTFAGTTTTDVLIKAVSDAGFTASTGTTVKKMETKKKTDGEECSGDCCDDEGGMKMKKSKKAEMKKS